MWLNLVEHLAWDQGVGGSSPPIQTTFALVAQLVERRTLNPGVEGSSPSGRTTCGYGVIGSRVGLRNQCLRRGGSIPSIRTTCRCSSKAEQYPVEVEVGISRFLSGAHIHTTERGGVMVISLVS